LSDVACIDLFKWRTVKGANLTDLYRSAWANYVREQVYLLQPKLIVALGASVGSSLHDLRYSEATLLIVRRHFSRLRPNDQQGERDIAAIESWLRDHSLLRSK
jgi:uracil-DNA glycosylase